VQGGRVVHAEDVDRLDLKVGGLELDGSAENIVYEQPGRLTCLMTQPSGSEASAPGKMYLFMLGGQQNECPVDSQANAALTIDPKRDPRTASSS
jgi:hypothetical protein